LADVKGRLEGHRDGHGFVIRDDGGGSIYLAPAEMRGVLHGDEVTVRVIRQDRKGRPEGRVLEILSRPKVPLIGRLLLENGGWIVAPEDRRFGQDILIPKAGVGSARARSARPRRRPRRPPRRPSCLVTRATRPLFTASTNVRLCFLPTTHLTRAAMVPTPQRSARNAFPWTPLVSARNPKSPLSRS
jgi:hypothetical protein